MALIKCPQCGQTVLSVASVCPKCGHMLMQNPLAQGGEGEFVECPRCNKFIPEHADRCGFCGYPRRARRRMWWAIGAVAFVAALVAGVVGARQVLGGGASSSPPPHETTERAGPAAEADETTTVAAEPQQPPPTAEPIVVAERGPARPDTTRAPVPTVAPPRPPATVPSTVNRWATTWANLREGPGIDYGVVRVLTPGERVRVASLTRGFWAVYDDGTIEGYVANSVLSDRQLPPDSLPASGAPRQSR
jgi:hypothetical protein